MKLQKILINILIILTLVVGTITILHANATIISTSVKLMVLNDNAQFYNEQDRKTDAMTEEYIANEAERQKIYNSDDIVVRVFSEQYAIVKLAILVWALASFLLIPYMWLVIIMWGFKILVHKSKKCGQRKVQTCKRDKQGRREGIA